MSTLTPLLPDFHERVSAWFLGPRAENFDILLDLFTGVLSQHEATRQRYYPKDGDFITADIKASDKFQASVDTLRQQVGLISTVLNAQAIPFFSGRYIGHMTTDTTMPSVIGWLMTILFNPNNVAFEASPITTQIELWVGKELCTMLGYQITDASDSPWAHIAADGTIANMESMWAARNLKFYPLSLHAAMTVGDNPPLAFIADDFKVTTCDKPDVPQLFRDLTTWQLLNLVSSVILNIPDNLLQQYGITADFLSAAISPWLAQTAGIAQLMKLYNVFLDPLHFVPSTKHYSWPKSAALVGIGSEHCINVAVDHDAHMDMDVLRAKLQDCLDNQRAVYAVVAVIGSTEEGAVDPLDQILDLREEFRSKGLYFLVHADAAWGGYYATTINMQDVITLPRGREYVPSMSLRPDTIKQYKLLGNTDSITIDPHKAGYIPYPAGGLCYRDGRMRFLLTWSAPYLAEGTGESIGIYGIEGSKPGAPAVACFLHHQAIGLGQDGHGALLGEATFTSRRMSAQWAAMSDDTTDFIVVPFNPLQSEDDKAFIRERILPKSNEEIVDDQDAINMLITLGSDVNINAFACNFRINGAVNDDVEEANFLNQRIFNRLSITRPSVDPTTVPLFLSATTFKQEDYGECVLNYETRLGLETDSRQDLFVLRNVVMSPFQSAGNFVQEIATIFQGILEEEVQVSITRNTVSPQVHEFVMQGMQTLYLAYRPNFYSANGRYQLVLSVEMASSDQKASYQAARQGDPSTAFIFRTSAPTTIEDILSGVRIVGDIVGGSTTISSVQVNILAVVKNRPLASRWRTSFYPASDTPFYLYGTQTEQNVDHVLVRAPNAQITSDLVVLQNVQPALTDAQLAKGVIARVNRPEAALQPFSDENDPRRIFFPGASFTVKIFEDTDGQAPPVDDGMAIATGTLALGQMLFTDYTGPNYQTLDAQRIRRSPTSTAFSAEVKTEWDEYLKNQLALGSV